MGKGFTDYNSSGAKKEIVSQVTATTSGATEKTRVTEQGCNNMVGKQVE